MNSSKSFSPEVKKEFDKLPPYVQETILQSSAEIENSRQLKKLADEIISQNGCKK